MTQVQKAAGEEHAPTRGLRSSRTARYIEVADQLREEIRSGKHPVGKAFPTEAVLCKRFSDQPFHRARGAAPLTEQGLILRRRGSGTLVRSAEMRVSYEQHIRSIEDCCSSPTRPTSSICTPTASRPIRSCRLAQRRRRHECIHLHGIRYHRRTQQPYCLGEVYRRVSWQGLPPGFATMEDALRQ